MMIARTRTLGLALPLAMAMASGWACPAGAQVVWRSPEAPVFAPRRDYGPVLEELVRSGEAGHLAVVLSRFATDQERSLLAAAGVRLTAPLGGRAYFAAIDGAQLDAGAIARLGLIEAAERIDARFKLHPAFAAGDDAAWTVVGTAKDAGGKSIPVVALYVLMHADVRADDPAAEAVVTRHGAVVRGRIRTINGLVVEMPLPAARGLAAEDAVQWIEPALPLLGPTNAENRTLTRVDQVQDAPYSLNGAGVTALIYDGGGVRPTHQDLAGRVTVIDGSANSNHATHVAGTVGGTGAASGGAHRGMAPAVTFLSASLSIDDSGWLYTNPSDIEADYTLAVDQGADVANNSIGTNVNANFFPCSWHGDYGVTDGVIDAIVRGSMAVSDGVPFRVVWAAGNERGGRCDLAGGFGTIGPPAGAKNHLSIGAVNANNDSMTSFSGWGPTDDGRLKPDFCAPGCQSSGDNGVTSTSNSGDTAYSVSCGTSMASPTATGIVALLLQDWANQYPGDPRPRNATLKALLAHSAVDLGHAGPDYRYGYGSIRADAAVDLLRSGAHAERSLNQDFRDRFTVMVAPGSGPLSFTIAWDDLPGTPNVSPALVNDLDLVVHAPGGQRHYPWTLNPASPDAPAVRNAEDHLNNIEQVRVDAPEPGEWTIEVRGQAIPMGSQAYTIVSSDTSFAYAGSVSVGINPITLAAPYVDAGVQVPLAIEVDVQGDTLVPGSVRVWVRRNGGSFDEFPMVDAGGGEFSGSMASGSCEDVLDYYFSAQTAFFGTVQLPEQGAVAPFTATVGQLAVPVTDDLETDTGWTVGAPGDAATAGVWNRMDPQPTAAQPGDDTTAMGVLCWVTDGVSGGSVGARDVDGGATTLLSPVFDLSVPAEYSISYWRWYSNNAGANPASDPFTVDVSADGTTWVNVETIVTGPQASGGWFQHSFRLADFVAPSATVRLRFVASDFGGGSIVEAAIDDLVITRVTCEEPCPADFDGNTMVEVSDIFTFLAAWFDGEPAAYEFGGTPGVPAIFAFLTVWFAGCP